MRAIGICAISVLLTSFVIGNAFYQKKQFYPSVVHITKSNSSMAVIYMQFFVCVLLLGKLFRKIFLGTLQTIEFEHLMERFWYALTETCLAFTVFRDDFNPRFVALFTVLLFIKSFHWLADQRVEYMERTPLLSWIFHIRIASLIGVLGVVDYWMTMHAYNSTVARGPTVQLVFGFEYAILLTAVASIGIRYALYAVETRADQTWENKAVFLLYTELVIGLIKVILYVVFVVIMAKIYALPMFVFRPMFFTMRNFKKALNDVIKSRLAIRNMNTLYPDATQEELAQADNLCIICREDMVSNSKKLPCGHIFHTSCLRSWFQRQQTCPTCRLNILRPHSTTLPQAPNVVPAAPIAPPAGNLENLFANIFNQAAANPPPPQAPVVAPNLTVNNQAESTATSTNSPVSNNQVPINPPFPFAMGSTFPPFPFMAPFTIPPPPMPPNLSTLSDEELRALEGNERQNVENRIKHLRNVQLMVEAASLLMNQYVTIAPTYVNNGQQSLSATIVDYFSTTDSGNDGKIESKTSNEASTSKQDLTKEVIIEDIGADEDNLPSQPESPSSTKSSTLISPSPRVENDSSSNSSTTSTSTDLHEVRRRWNQKFTQNNNTTSQ